MKIKVCGMKNPQNIEALGKLPIDFMGMIFYPKSPRFVGDLHPNKLPLSNEINRVGVFVNADMEELITYAEKYQLDYIQLHGNESVEYVKELKSRLDSKIIKAFNVANAADFEAVKQYENEVDFVLFDTKTEQHGGSGKKFDWSILSFYRGEIPFFLSGGITLEDAEIIKQLNHPQLFAVDINSKFEVEPGLKNILQIENFIKNIQS